MGWNPITLTVGADGLGDGRVLVVEGGGGALRSADAHAVDLWRMWRRWKV